MNAKDNLTMTLNDDRQMPQLGFGTFKIQNDDATEIVHNALDVGYWLIDTAALYENEAGVGKSIGEWSDIFLTTKIWNESQGFDRSKKAFARCLNRLGRDYVDLLLIHWPCPEKDLFVETWKAFIELRDEGLAKSIGVANFREEDLRRLVSETGVTPAINQIELHPSFQQRDMRKVHDEMGIVTQSWSPLGHGNAISSDVIRAVANETGQPAAAVIIRWHIQCGLSPIPKASSREHMEANFSALGFELSDKQMKRIDDLDDPEGRIGPDPADLN